MPIFDAGEADGYLYIAMRLVLGGDLRTLLATEGRLPPTQAVDIIAQAAGALDAAHAQGLIHRDVKPANILLGRTSGTGRPDYVYLSDFGLTKQSDSQTGLTASGGFLGTPGFIAPEQIEGRTLDERVDVYALGCVLYTCLTGEQAYPRDSTIASLWAHLQEPPPRATALVPDLPPAMDDVIGQAMARAPQDRYQTAGELAAAAHAALTDDGAVVPVAAAGVATIAAVSGGPAGPPGGPDPVTVGHPAASPRGPGPSRRPIGVAVGVIVAVLAVAGLAYAYTSTSGAPTPSSSGVGDVMASDAMASDAMASDAMAHPSGDPGAMHSGAIGPADPEHSQPAPTATPTASPKPTPSRTPAPAAVLDTQAPTGSVKIDSGNKYSSDPTVKLALPAHDNKKVLLVRISNGSSRDGATEYPYTPTRDWNVSSGIGKKTVSVWYSDGRQWSTRYSDTITFDHPPTGGDVYWDLTSAGYCNKTVTFTVGAQFASDPDGNGTLLLVKVTHGATTYPIVNKTSVRFAFGTPNTVIKESFDYVATDTLGRSASGTVTWDRGPC